MKKWLKRIALGLLSLFLAVLLTGVVYEAYSRYQAEKDFPPPGQMVNIGGRLMQLDCRGSGQPVVVFENGLDSKGSLAWARVHDAVAGFTRACAYSRAGVMWSDPTENFSSQGVANDLRATLKAAGEQGPYVLAAHSLGGPYAMVFTRLFPDEVAGVVFVDASHPDQEATLAEVIPIKVEDVLPMFKALSYVSWTGATRVLIAMSQAGEPTQPQAVAEAVAAYSAQSMSPVLEELLGMRDTFADAGQFRDLGDRPTYVLTAAAPPTEESMQTMQMKPEDVQKFRDLWVSLHVDEASWSTNSQHQLVPEATHYIQFDAPDRVIEAITWVVDEVRSNP